MQFLLKECTTFPGIGTPQFWIENSKKQKNNHKMKIKSVKQGNLSSLISGINVVSSVPRITVIDFCVNKQYKK